MALIFNAEKQIYATTLGEDEVIIGNEKSASFEPHIQFTKWNKENSLSVIPDTTLFTSTTLTLSADKIEIGDAKTGFYFEPQEDGVNFKFGVTLYEIPLNPSIVTIDGKKYFKLDYQVENWEEYNWYYQPPLTNIEPDGSSWEGWIDHPVLGHIHKNTQSAESNGSWCIYHKTKANNQYKIGKMGVIYRPKFIDADGKWVWGLGLFDNGVFSELVSEDFVLSAKLPVKSNATYGNTSNPTGAEASKDDRYCTVYNVAGTMPENGTITKLHIWLRWELTDNIRINYYGNDGNKCSASDVQGTYGNADNVYHDYSYNISGDSENSGDKLAVGFRVDGGSPNVMYDTTTGTNNKWQCNTWHSPWTEALESPKPTANAEARQYGVYMEYTPTGGAAGPSPTLKFSGI